MSLLVAVVVLHLTNRISRMWMLSTDSVDNIVNNSAQCLLTFCKV